MKCPEWIAAERPRESRRVVGTGWEGDLTADWVGVSFRDDVQVQNGCTALCSVLNATKLYTENGQCYMNLTSCKKDEIADSWSWKEL